MDKLFDESGQPLEKLTAVTRSGLESIAGKGTVSTQYGDNAYRQDPRPTPQRRGFCLRRGLVQRYWLGQNVGLLPFCSAAMARSVGCTAAELSALPINPLAVEVVFDALSQSQVAPLLSRRALVTLANSSLTHFAACSYPCRAESFSVRRATSGARRTQQPTAASMPTLSRPTSRLDAAPSRLATASCPACR